MKGPSEWKWGYGDEDDRPDKNGLLIFQDDINNGSWFFVIECEKDALLNGKNIISDIALNNNTALIVQKFGSKKVAGDEAIIRNDLVPRAKQMLGKFLRWVDEDNEIGLYELNNPAEK